MLDRCVSFTNWHMETFCEQFEVMDQLFHIGLHIHTAWWRNLGWSTSLDLDYYATTQRTA